MKKRLLIAFLSIIAIVGCAFGLSACGKSETDGVLNYKLSKGTYQVVGFEGEPTEIVIPAVFNGTKVTAIGDGAFAGCGSLVSIEIPDSIKSIGHNAFSENFGLEKVAGGTGVTSIGEKAFYSCRGLTSLTIGAAVKSVEKSAFDGCSGITSITVSSGNTVYHSNGNCLIETETKTLILGCNSSVIPTDGSVTSIGEDAFKGFGGLTSVTIPDSVTSIGNGAFSGCSGLTSITVPDSVTCIGLGWFKGCNGLTDITLPDSITHIGQWAFLDCSNLRNITYNGTKEQWNAISKELLGSYRWDANTGNYTIHCTDGDVSK